MLFTNIKLNQEKLALRKHIFISVLLCSMQRELKKNQTTHIRTTKSLFSFFWCTAGFGAENQITAKVSHRSPGLEMLLASQQHLFSPASCWPAQARFRRTSQQRSQLLCSSSPGRPKIKGNLFLWQTQDTICCGLSSERPLKAKGHLLPSAFVQSWTEQAGFQHYTPNTPLHQHDPGFNSKLMRVTLPAIP